jgi:DNA-binding protein WhiA
MKLKEAGFAAKVRNEIFASKPLQGEGKRSFAYGLLSMGNRFDNEQIKLATESEPVANLACRALTNLAGIFLVPNRKTTKNGNYIYTLEASSPSLIRIIMVSLGHMEGVNRSLAEENPYAFLAGAFLSCGTLSNPERGYHLIFQPPTDELCDYLFELLTREGCPPKTTLRRGKSVLYYKESEPIEEILTMIGATKSALELMELKIYKDLRNRANRSTNCETANIDKLVKSSSQQLRDILLLREAGVLQTLTAHLVEMASLRENNPDASLGELAQLAGISRSGVYHRIAKLHKIANALK